MMANMPVGGSNMNNIQALTPHYQGFDSANKPRLNCCRGRVTYPLYDLAWDSE